MKRPLILLSFFVSGHLAHATTPAEMASKIEAAFAKMDGPQRLIELVKESTKPAEQKLLLERASSFKTLPTVKANGPNLRMTFGTRVENWKVLDADKILFLYKGVEVDLNPERPLADRLKQISALTDQDGESASVWTWLFPRAFAADTGAGGDLAMVGLGAVTKELNENEQRRVASGSALKLEFVCNDLVRDPETKLPGSFPSEVDRAVIERSNAKKNPMKRDVRNGWAPRFLAYLEKTKDKYCVKRTTWEKIWADDSKPVTCEQMKKTISCFQKLKDKDVALYKPHYDEMLKWLGAIIPGGGVTPTQLAEQVGIGAQQTQMATQKAGASR